MKKELWIWKVLMKCGDKKQNPEKKEILKPKPRRMKKKKKKKHDVEHEAKL